MEAPGADTRNTAGDFAAAGSANSDGFPAQMGGYKMLRELGRGGLGVVYLAQQLSLNRNVAVKLIQSQVAKSSTAISRFFREAYAAAQLVHHNVVQIYDLGQDGETNFFSMEFVQGQNLSDLLKQNGPLEPRQAAGYILQAARGLQFAHHQGMVHRDIKPANLMLDQHGVVKVADLGLVKLPDTADEPVDQVSGDFGSGSIQLTGVGATVGTVNYISPEQAASSSDVDHRADIYSLGCTFYALLTGAPPFKGNSAKEVLEKHKSQPVARPETIAPRIDRRLSDIVVKMMEKQPANRYQDLSTLINDLQTFLGIASGSAFAPSQTQAQQLEASQKAYYSQALAQARTFLPMIFLGLGLLATVVLVFFSWPWALASLSALFVAPLTVLVVAGFRQQSLLFDKARELAMSGGWKRWITAIGIGTVLLAILFALGILGPWLVATLLAVGLGIGYFFVIEQSLAQEREKSLANIRQMLRDQRVSGVDEDMLRRFVAQYSGSNWEEYFEDLFGYDALQKAKIELVGNATGPRRKRFRPWRDALIARIDKRLAEQRKEQDVSKLRTIEQKALVASGMPPAQAAAEADRVSQLLVHEAASWRSAAANYQANQSANPQAAVLAKRARVKALLAEGRSSANRRPPSLLAKLEKPLDTFLGAHVRLIFGALLIVGCVLWIRQNEIFSNVTVESVKSAAGSLQQGGGNLGDVASQVGFSSGKPREPLSIPIVGIWVSNFNAGIAGLLLVVSVIFGGWRASLVALPLAAIILAGLPLMLR